jgi:hypothetical protein
MTNVYKFLGFFDKTGSDLNFVFDEETGVWEGTVHIPEVSVNLFETSTIFIVEEFKTTGGITRPGIPHFSDPFATGTQGTQWTAKWEDNNTEDIFLYSYNISSNKPELVRYEEYDIIVDIDPIQTGDTNTGQIITDVITSKAIQINIALNSSEEDIFERTLLIEETSTGNLIARIDFYGETISEDERLPQNLYKLGMDISPDEYKVFRKSDINELLPDYELINEKRVELLVEGRNIKPFVGSYKGLINAIKFYGYDNIKIREYWLNVDSESANYGKYKTTEVRSLFDQNVDFDDNSFELPNKIYKKTSLFSLVYRLNQLTGDLDEYEIPITEETSDFTLDEVLIKLYGLKNVLMEKWLAGNSRIIDITGEADYFGKIEQNVWVNQNRIEKIDVGINPCFNILPSKKGYIQDLRKIEDIFFPAVTPYLIDPNLLAGSDLTAGYLADMLLAYFTNYSPNLKSVEQLPDKPGIPVGYPVVLENCSFGIKWNDAKISYNELIATGNLLLDFSPKNIGSGDTFIIKDTISGEQVSYTASFGDDELDVVNNLFSLIQNELTTGDGRPWSYYSITKEDINGDNTLDTLRFRQIFTANIGTNFIGQTVNGGLQQSPGPEMPRKFATGTNINTWETYGLGNFYEIEWRVYKNADTTPAYETVIRGDMSSYNTIALNLPYVGKYSIEMKLYDTFNQVSRKTEIDAIEVIQKNVEFVGFYKAQDKSYNWSNVSINWNSYSSYWQLPIVPESMTWDGEASLYESLDRSNYILNNSDPDIALSYHYENPNSPVQNILYTPGAYFWDNLDTANWNDVYHLWWSATKVSGDTPANFRIYGVGLNEILEISQFYPIPGSGIHVFGTNDLEAAAEELNTSTDPIISKYIYNPVYDITTAANTDVVFIQAVAKYFGESGDWTDLTYTPGIDIRYPDLHETNNPTWNEIRFIENGKVLPKLTHITFTYDKAKIPGKDKPKWRIINNDNQEYDDIYFTGRWLTYLFKREGRYTVQLELEDSNGNINSVSKNMVIIK